MNVLNPATGRMIDSLDEPSSQQITVWYKEAVEAQKAWKDHSIQERLQCIQKFTDLLESEKHELAEVLTSESGKPLQQSINEINGARGRIAYFLAKSQEVLEDEVMVDQPDLREIIVHEPLGVIGNISAWNYPYLVGVNVFIPALIAGNAVLYKPSEFATLTGLEIERLLLESGVPQEVFRCVVGGASAGKTLIDLPLDGYFFTGSHATGQKIYEQVAPKMVPCGLELGGKDPLYVMAENSDLKAVAVAAAEGAFYNAGQSCCAVERIYVHEKVYDDFVASFVEEVKGYKVGNPLEEGVFIGAVTREAQIEVLKSQVADALAKGAKVVQGGNAIEGWGNYFEPTVILDVNHSMKLMKEESFGPIIGIQKVESDREALALMQDTPYGLTAALYADKEEVALPLMKALNTGTVYFNCCDRVSPNVPWSGRGKSGFGSTLSYMGIRAFSRPKSFQIRPK